MGEQLPLLRDPARKSDGKTVRLVWVAELNRAYQGLRSKVQAGAATPEEAAEFETLDEAEKATILDAEPTTLFDVIAVAAPVPVMSTVGQWVSCARCEEQVMGDHTRQLQGDAVCVPCFEADRAAA